MKKFILFCLFIGVTTCFLFAQATPDYTRIDNQIIVQLKPGISPEKIINNHPNLHLRHLKTLGHTHHIHLFESNTAAENLSKILRKEKNIIAVQSNYRVKFYGEPNDSLFDEQWNMDMIRMPQVWEHGTGGLTTNGDTIVVAIVDSGFNIDHPDLSPNVWHNYAEIPNNGIDDDQNGYIDDITGWNFRENSPIHGLSKHGHSVASLAGAKGDNEIGISGVNQTIKLLLLDITEIDEIIAAYEYLYDLRDKYNKTNGQEGAFIVANNASWGIENAFCSQLPVLASMYDRLGEVGILSIAAPSNNEHNVDILGDIPAACLSPYIISVLNTDRLNRKVYNSSYGKKSIDIGVPGDEVPSLALNGYRIFSGNSAAAPQLTGAVGLLYSYACTKIIDKTKSSPGETALLLKEIILTSAFKIPALQSYCSSGGRLNMQNCFQSLEEACNSTSGTLEILSIFPNPTRFETKIIYQSPNFEEYQVVVFNSLGQKVKSKTTTPFLFGQKHFTINTSTFPPGVYEIAILQGKKVTTDKLVVVR